MELSSTITTAKTEHLVALKVQGDGAAELGECFDDLRHRYLHLALAVRGLLSLIALVHYQKDDTKDKEDHSVNYRVRIDNDARRH